MWQSDVKCKKKKVHGGAVAPPHLTRYANGLLNVVYTTRRHTKKKQNKKLKRTLTNKSNAKTKQKR